MQKRRREGNHSCCCLARCFFLRQRNMCLGCGPEDREREPRRRRPRRRQCDRHNFPPVLHRTPPSIDRRRPILSSPLPPSSSTSSSSAFGTQIPPFPSSSDYSSLPLLPPPLSWLNVKTLVRGRKEGRRAREEAETVFSSPSFFILLAIPNGNGSAAAAAGHRGEISTPISFFSREFHRGKKPGKDSKGPRRRYSRACNSAGRFLARYA